MSFQGKTIRADFLFRTILRQIIKDNALCGEQAAL